MQTPSVVGGAARDSSIAVSWSSSSPSTRVTPYWRNTAEVTASAGLVRYDRGRGAALVDLNLDGRLDLVESFYRAPVTVWRCASRPGNASGGNSPSPLNCGRPGNDPMHTRLTAVSAGTCART